MATIDSQTFRRVLGHYPTGVCVITAMDEEAGPVSMVVGSFVSVSLDPPLVGFFPALSSQTWPNIRRAGRFRVNVLGRHQLDLCKRFAASGKNKFEGLDYRLSDHGSPMLDDVVAWMECSLDAVHGAGDHEIAIGRVLALDVLHAETPLLFFQGKYGEFSSL